MSVDETDPRLGPLAPGSGGRAADAVARLVRDDWGRLVARLVGRFGRLDLVEDALGDAVEVATRRWAVDGVPNEPAAWMTTVASRRMLDRLRTEEVARRRMPVLVTDAVRRGEGAVPRADPGGLVEDDVLRLALMCAHPVLGAESACALTLRLVLGLGTDDIARLFLVHRSTMAARITRAKARIAAAGVPFAMPDAAVLPGRLDVLAQTAYLAFTAGYAPSGSEVVRVDLADEAVRLVRVLLAAAPGEPVLVALLSLELFHHCRRDARVDTEGRLVLLADQDRGRWRRDEITEAAGLLATLARRPLVGLAASYAVQAQIAAEHALAPTPEATRWSVVVDLYDLLLQVAPTPPARLARAVAVAEAHGAAAGLADLDSLARESTLASGHRLPAVRAELLTRLGRREEARVAYDEALARCPNDAERAHLEARRSAAPG